ncbi:MAG: anhydro-N-acetylmuramic acid kinase [Burkholderiales bacterium]|nr:anhydro-N-acetylmuramic acid kinase [Burkholderiales bacterium]
MAWFIGLMSGTSLDGIDGVAADFDADGSLRRTGAHAHHAFDPALAAELLALNRRGDDELRRAALAANALARACADVVAVLLAQAGLEAAQVVAVGAHGQTVRHRPHESDGTGYTVQLLNGALLAECCGIDVVCDFRSRDLAAGGEGAPLVPAFHAAALARPGSARALLNLGGIANLTLLDAAGAVRGFDCGPANLLLDLWCQRHHGQPFDAGGTWAAGGTIDPGLLQRLLDEPYFARRPPKSTGRDLFGAAWLDPRIGTAPPAPQDVMATLAELTAATVAHDLQREAPATTELFVCGGGAFNGHLLSRLRARLGPAVKVDTTAAAGLAPDQVEALAFAWLAASFVARRPGTLPAVTGARGARVLGALYPA